VWGPGSPSTTHASTSMTMCFALVSLTAVNLGIVMRRDRQSPFASPLFPFYTYILVGWALIWAAVELPMLERVLDTVSLSAGQFGVAFALSLIVPLLLGVDHWLTLRREARRTDSPVATRAPARLPATIH